MSRLSTSGKASTSKQLQRLHFITPRESRYQKPGNKNLHSTKYTFGAIYWMIACILKCFLFLQSSRRTRPTQLLNESPGPMKQPALRSRPDSKTGTRSVSSSWGVTKVTDSLNITSDSTSTTAAANGQKGVGTAAGSQRMTNEMLGKGTRSSAGISRTGHAAVRGVFS